MGIVVPLWIWLPVVLWVMWRWERRNRQRLEMRWVVGEQVVSSREPQLLLGEVVKKSRRRTEEGGGVMEMRSMMIVAVFGLLSAILYAREPGPAVVVAENAASPAATASPTQWPTQALPPRHLPGEAGTISATPLPGFPPGFRGVPGPTQKP